MEKGKQVEIFSDISIAVPQFAGSSEKVFDMNNDGATTLSKLKIGNLQMPSNIAKLIRDERLSATGAGTKEPKTYSGFDDLIKRLGSRRKLSDRPINNYDIGLQTLVSAQESNRIKF